MPFATAPPMARIVTLLQTALGVNAQVFTGVPESFAKHVSAYVAIAGQDVTDKATELLQRDARYFVGLGYRVNGAEATAETDLAAAIDSFLTSFYADRKTGLNGTALSTKIDVTLADQPQYQTLAGQEYRIFPILITATQQQNT